MTACASLPVALINSARRTDRPVMLLDGVIEPRLIVERVELTGPLDMRTAILRMDGLVRVANDWRVAEPIRLSDDQVRWRVWVHGTQPQRMDSEKLTLTGRWSQFLTRPIDRVPGLDREGKLVTLANGLLAHTRSESRVEVNGQMIYVLQNKGNPWTVYDALESVSVMAGLDLNLRGLPRRTREADLVSQIDLSLSLERVLEQILDPYGLTITRDIAFSGHTQIEYRDVRPLSHGRRVSLRWMRSGQPLSQALKMIRRKPDPGSRQWIGQARGPLVESTFTLVGGWDPVLEGAASDEYDRSASNNFSLYANVYRHWVLNEDGAYTDAPFNRGDAYDLASLFNQGPMASTPLRFSSGVTLNGGGNGQSPIVEFSIDSGTNWSRWVGRIRVLTDSAGVYLDDTTLPTAFLTAALANTARVRVTASLRSPLPVQITRWQGNPFSGVRPPRELNLSNLFLFKRVDSGSIHFADVQSGVLSSDERDDALAMHTWLVDRMWRDEQTQDRYEGEAELTLMGAGFDLKPADQLLNAGGLGLNSDEQAQALHQSGGLVIKVRHDYESSSTRVRFLY